MINAINMTVYFFGVNSIPEKIKSGELGIFRDDGGIGQNFSDIEEYLGKCKFRNCSHTKEPGCAIKNALSDGLISRER